MPLPATVGDADAKWPNHKNSFVGPFINGTDIYACLVDTTNNQIEMWKSTDEGETWTEQDTANKPSCSATAALKTCYCAVSGDTIHVAFPSNSANAVNIKPFNMTNDTWATSITGGPVIQTNDSLVILLTPLILASRADGSFVIFYAGATQSIMGTAYERIKIHYYNGAWNGPYDVIGSANSPLSNTLPGTETNYQVGTIVKGADERVHLFFTNNSTGSVYHRALLSGNTFATGQQLFVNCDRLTGYSIGMPVSYTSGSATHVVVPYDRLTSPRMVVVRGDSADQPIWTSGVVADVTAHGTAAISGSVAVLTSKGVEVYIAWYARSDDTFWLDNDQGDTIWGVDTIYSNPIRLAGYSMNYLPLYDRIGILYNLEGTVKYDYIAITPILSPLSGILQPL